MGEDGQAAKPKYIYVVRNPKDVAVSFYHQYKNLRKYEFGDRTWDEFFNMFINDKGMNTYIHIHSIAETLCDVLNKKNIFSRVLSEASQN